MDPRHTFCIPNKNKLKYLKRCIDSVLAQDWSAWRCIIVDGYSDDGSWEFVNQYANDPRFKIMRGTHNGMYADWNHCIAHVDTEYFTVLPSDDFCEPNLSSAGVHALEENFLARICASMIDIVGENERIIKTAQQVTKDMPLWSSVNNYSHFRECPLDFIFHISGSESFINSLTLVCQTSLFHEIGGFSSAYGSCGDIDWYIRAAARSSVVFRAEKCGSWRMYAEQASSSTDEISTIENLLRIRTASLALLNQIGLSATDIEELQEQLSQFIRENAEQQMFRAAIRSLRPGQTFNFSNALKALSKTSLQQSIRFLEHRFLHQHDRHESNFRDTILKKGLFKWPPEPC